jgi:Ankyrin repeats (3 copies)
MMHHYIRLTIIGLCFQATADIDVVSLFSVAKQNDNELMSTAVWQLLPLRIQNRFKESNSSDRRKQLAAKVMKTLRSKTAQICKKNKDRVAVKRMFQLVMGYDKILNKEAVPNDPNDTTRLTMLQKELRGGVDPDASGENIGDNVGGGEGETVSGEGMTALMWAVDRGYVDLVKALVGYGADVNKKDTKKEWTPLHFAAARGNVDLVNYLLEQEADPKALNIDENTPLDLASANQRNEVVKILTPLT